ncbi:hypothetical protein L2E69_06150 [Planktothrix agardhii 1806]|jgi:hypothetical protein|uniref:hypothetical protein n=2 Tax=Planktothrix agardhii TaxID=1160 RepID=UPI001F1BA64C|nr:hypothetical protein [Planktothrix agardhii]MCF3570248.1 hypothetical protein [Planktothrix agardhii 1805]MCF3586703.1 hypothetical protein [Planktothrix agardhii 1803]MCF3603568.1 hypothetical protein [Planktothrix agardhii 1804]MCF3615524.1 hypothetical protein [Planktothrix agardhii 1806]MEA5562100.1 hypothetical protein [Planktothrix agardhii UHCC 0887]
MKELEVYVISSALGKTGIHWRKVESSQSVLGYPDMLEKRLVKKKNGDLGTIEYRINYQKLSFVIMRHSQQLLFLVAGIEALEERSNQLGSTIYNAVAWVANPDESNSISPENELMLRHLAARALLSFVGKDKDPEFINTINEAINFKGLEEFEVNLNKINQLTENSADKLEQLLPNLDKAEGDQQIWYKKVEKTSNEQEIISLAEKIINTGLPEDDLAILISKGDENAVSVSPIDLDLKTKQSEVSKDQEDPDSALIEGNETEKPDQKSKEVSDEKKLIKLLLIFFLITSLLVLLLVVINRINKEKEEPNQISTPQTIISPQTNHSI